MKVSRVYEVWVGGDMIDDQLTLQEALDMARDEFKREQKEHPEDPADVVLDEHSYVEIEDEEDLDTIDFVPKWRDSAE